MTDQQIKEMFESYGQYAHGHDYALVRAIEAVVSPKREWVNLTDEEIEHAYMHTANFVDMARVLEDILQEKNT